MKKTPPHTAMKSGALAFGILLSLELIGRFGAGLGDPPLVIKDPTIEYLAKPSEEYRRFGHRILINSYSMRSPEFPVTKSDPLEKRILVVGDSVINGGAPTDQAGLATTLLQEHLMSALSRPVVVGNISAGSWGPPNLAAYLRKFGYFDADLLILVVSSHDALDVPTFGPLGPENPETKPILALNELIDRYFLPWLQERLRPQGPAVAASPESEARSQKICLNSISEIAAACARRQVSMRIVQHLEREEIISGPHRGHTAIKKHAEELGIPIVSDQEWISDTLGRGQNPYRDNIHLNELGQKLLEAQLFELATAALSM